MKPNLTRKLVNASLALASLLAAHTAQAYSFEVVNSTNKRMDVAVGTYGCTWTSNPETDWCAGSFAGYWKLNPGESKTVGADGGTDGFQTAFVWVKQQGVEWRSRYLPEYTMGSSNCKYYGSGDQAYCSVPNMTAGGNPQTFPMPKYMYDAISQGMPFHFYKVDGLTAGRIFRFTGEE